MRVREGGGERERGGEMNLSGMGTMEPKSPVVQDQPVQRTNTASSRYSNDNIR